MSATLESELRDLGTIPIPTALLARTWFAILGELSTVQAVVTAAPAGTTPLKLPVRLVGATPSPCTPDGPRCAPIRAAGGRRGASHA